MADTTTAAPVQGISVRHRGRLEQIGIYLGKFLRMFFYQSDWKVLPMSALIAGLIGLVMGPTLFVTLEGTAMGAFALVMVCIWNGCFNSIQVICRERDVIKREHRSGMHVSAYVTAHMIYQALLCLMQTVITLSVTKVAGVHYELCKPLFGSWFLLDFGITVFLITFASDMMALWISTLCHSTTAAMTIMPFVLIFQLVFSGGMLSLPAWSKPLTRLTISSPGINAMAAQGEANKRPLVSLWNSVQSMGNMEIAGEVTLGQVLDFLDSNTPLAAEISKRDIRLTVTVGQVLDFLHNGQSEELEQLRAMKLSGTVNMYQALSMLQEADLTIPAASEDDVASVKQLIDRMLQDPKTAEELRAITVSEEMTLGELVDAAVVNGMLDPYREQTVTIKRSIGELADAVNSNPDLRQLRAEGFPVKTTVAEVQSMIGVDRARSILQEKAAASRIKPEYEWTRTNVAINWLSLMGFILLFALLSMITLKFIDKDKR